MPQDYNKAKRSITKIVNTYFNILREEIKCGAKINVDRNRLDDVEDAITAYVGLRYNDRPMRLDLKLRAAEDTKNKEKGSGGLLAYLPESEKIVGYSSAGKMSVKEISKPRFKLPDIATPIGFENNVYFLDPCNFEKKRNTFVPDGPAFVVGLEGKVREIEPPIYFRSRCAVVKKG